MTQAGFLLGTVLWMPPERWLDEPSTPASDVFQLALITQALLSGRHHMEGRVRMDLMSGKVYREMARGAFLPPGLPSRLRRVILQGLSVKPEERPDASVFRDGLSAHTGSGAMPRRFASQEKPRREERPSTGSGGGGTTRVASRSDAVGGGTGRVWRRGVLAAMVLFLGLLGPGRWIVGSLRPPLQITGRASRRAGGGRPSVGPLGDLGPSRGSCAGPGGRIHCLAARRPARPRGIGFACRGSSPGAPTRSSWTMRGGGPAFPSGRRRPAGSARPSCPPWEDGCSWSGRPRGSRRFAGPCVRRGGSLSWDEEALRGVCVVAWRKPSTVPILSSGASPGRGSTPSRDDPRAVASWAGVPRPKRRAPWAAWSSVVPSSWETGWCGPMVRIGCSWFTGVG